MYTTAVFSMQWVRADNYDGILCFCQNLKQNRICSISLQEECWQVYMLNAWKRLQRGIISSYQEIDTLTKDEIIFLHRWIRLQGYITLL